jgi:hypothetical protein
MNSRIDSSRVMLAPGNSSTRIDDEYCTMGKTLGLVKHAVRLGYLTPRLKIGQ